MFASQSSTQKLFLILVYLLLLPGMFFLNSGMVLAQDTPPVTPVEEPPPEDSTTDPAPPEESVPPQPKEIAPEVEEPAPDGSELNTLTNEETIQESAVTETDQPPVTPPSQTSVEDVIAAGVEALQETGSVIRTGRGEVLPLSSVEAADLLAEGDPVIIRGTTTYNFLPTGSTCPIGNVCVFSDTPITTAIQFAVPGEQITIAAGSYTEDVMVDKDVLLIGGSAGVYQQFCAQCPGHQSVIMAEYFHQ
jgi:hypothetical protein